MISTESRRHRWRLPPSSLAVTRDSRNRAKATKLVPQRANYMTRNRIAIVPSRIDLVPISSTARRTWPRIAVVQLLTGSSWWAALGHVAWQLAGQRERTAHTVACVGRMAGLDDDSIPCNLRNSARRGPRQDTEGGMSTWMGMSARQSVAEAKYRMWFRRVVLFGVFVNVSLGLPTVFRPNF